MIWQIEKAEWTMQSRLKELLSTGYEPFAVTETHTSTPVIWLRRQV